MRRQVRTRLGKKFSEAARLLWGVKADTELSNAGLASALGLGDGNSGQVSKLLWGDILPSRQQALRIAEYDPRIQAHLWDERPTEPFEPPAVTELRKQIAKDTRSNRKRGGHSAVA